MSAIFGQINLNSQPVCRDHLVRMSTSMASLGNCKDSIWVNGHIGLGCRQMQFTPEDSFELQPLISSDRQSVLVCDARLDNRAELAAALDIPLSEARYLPDSVYFQSSYEKWGVECVQHLIGDYALAIWDARAQRLFLARSPVGGRPLFFYTTSNLFAFATRPAGLFALPNIPRKLNLERIADYLVHAPVEPGAGFFGDINRLHAGNCLSVSHGSVNERKFWQPELQQQLHYTRDDEYVDTFNALFERVVADHLRSASPVGVMMSGGLDSTSVAAVAATQLKQQGKRLATFTEVPRDDFNGQLIAGRYADETPFAKAMARRYDTIDLNLIRTGGRFYIEDIDSFFTAANMPFRNASNRTWIEAILQEASHQGVNVLLTGMQGNLTISRDGQGLLPLLVRGGHWRQAIHEARAMGTGSTLRTLFGRGVMPLLPTPLFVALQRLRGNLRMTAGASPWLAYSAINPDFARTQRVGERARERGFGFLPRMDPNVRLSYGKMLPGSAMGVTDIFHAYRGLYGIDVRDPTADVRIVEFCLALPEEQYLKNGVSRRLIRRAMANRLPAEILDNNLRGLQAADWFDRLLASREKLLLELTEWEKSDVLTGILDLKKLVRLLEHMPQANGDAAQIMLNYRQTLESGLMMGRFIRWFEDGRYVNA